MGFRSRSSRLFAACAGLAFLSGPPTVQSAEYHLIPALSISEIYNDNVFGSGTVKTADWISTPEPSLGLSITGAEHKQLFSYSMPFEFFWKRSELNTISYLGSYKADFQADPRLLLTFSQRTSYSPEIATSIFPEASTQPETFRKKSLRNATEFGPRLKWTERTDVAALSRVFFQKFNGATPVPGAFTATNTFQAGETVSVEHRLSERDTLLSGVSYDHFWFEGESNATSIGPELGWNRKWFSSFETRTAAGLLEAWQGGGSSLSVTGSGSAFYKLVPWDVHVLYTRGLVGTPLSGGAVSADTVSLGSTYSFRDVGSFGLGGGYFRTGLGSSVGGHLSGVFGDALFVMRLSRWITASASYEYRVQYGEPSTPTSIGADFTRNRAVITLSVSPPVVEEAPKRL
ncbi:MAG: hypothetical protein V1798_04015 [Pseudomonadota bacterium]